MRNEICSNNLSDFGLKKSLDHLDAVRQKFQTITDRFAGCQAELAQRSRGLPAAATHRTPHYHRLGYSGVKIHQAHIIRLLKLLLHGGSHLSGWTALQIYQDFLTTFGLAEKSAQAQGPRSASTGW